MRETWLRPNRRAILFGCVPPIAFAVIGAWFALRSNASANPAGCALTWIAFLSGVVVASILLVQLRRPRIAFQNGHVLFYLRSGSAISVPVDVVEAFFAGQGPAHLPVVSKQPQTVNLIARLSRRHPEWAEQQVKPALGKWSDGYVTIRGSWCEPLDSEVIRRLNRRLKEVTDNREVAASN
jgi:hypothetical protein